MTDIAIEARAIAERALERQDAHERHCGERWSEARQAMRDTENAVQDLRRELKRRDWWLISILLSVVGTVAVLFVNGTIRVQ